MNFCVLPFLMFFLLPITISQNYFTYSDCDQTCIQKNISCTIYQIQDDFKNLCEESEIFCEQESGPNCVCLRLNRPPIGGEDIWIEFKRKYHPPTPKPNPSPAEVKCLTWKILTSTVPLLLILLWLTRYVYQTYKKRHEVEVITDVQDEDPNQATVQLLNE